MARMISDSTLSVAAPLPAGTPPRRAAWWRLALRQLLRDFAAGELRLLALAVTLAVAALAAVGFFASRIDAGLARDARQMLGGDALVGSDQPPPAEVAAQARAFGLDVSTSASFPSMARAPDDKGASTRLVAVKSVSDGYPLRGRLQIRTAPDAPPRTVAARPAPGEAWVDAPVLDSLGLAVGDALLLGDATLRIAQIIVVEPDRGAGFLSFAPRVMINAADLPATGLIQPASRVGWRLAVAAPPGREAAVQRFIDWTKARIEAQQWRGIRVESLETGRPEMRQTLARAQRFLNLVALLAALLAAVAVAIASRDFASRHLDACAMLRVLGSSQRTIALQYFGEFAAVGLIASAAGVALGWAVHYVFVWLLAGLVAVDLPPPSVWPALFGVGVGFTLLLAFGLPPVLQLASVPPLRVIRRDVGALKPASIAVLGGGAAGFVALLLAVASDLKLGLIAVGGFAGALALFALAAWLAVQLLRRAVPESRAPRWLVLATRQVAARPAFAVLQVSSLSVGLLALMLLVLLRTDLVDGWRQATPPDAPDRFVINVQPDQAAAFRQRLDAAGIGRYDWYPMFRGRLVAIDGRPISSASFAEDAQKRTVEREFNLSHSAVLPDRNTITAGRWTPDEPGAISVEDRLAANLGLGLGDTMRFDVAGIPVEGRITSLRKVDWGSMRANFFVLFPRSRLADLQGDIAAAPASGGDGAVGASAASAPAATPAGDPVPVPASTTPSAVELPATYMAAFRAPATRGFDGALAREFPNITVVDVSASIGQIQRVLDQVIRAVEFLFGFTLAAGLVVLFAALAATREARAREFAVMRALGASGRLLARVQRAELLGVGALAGVLASCAAIAIGWALARWVFEFEWHARPWIPLAGGAAGAALALAAGWWGLREVLARPVIETLRSAAD